MYALVTDILRQTEEVKKALSSEPVFSGEEVVGYMAFVFLLFLVYIIWEEYKNDGR